MRSAARVLARLRRRRRRARARLDLDADRRDAVRVRGRRGRRAHSGQRSRDLLHGQELRDDAFVFLVVVVPIGFNAFL